ncbi:rod shape-determining protein MreC [Candidatus Palauibacter irciniicola]|uniref:rod shape-determining protein MreC n=1 Tax=Candidatus Palauibacter irciniicola TaxID=3056733 RepID=UPI003B01F76C
MSVQGVRPPRRGPLDVIVFSLALILSGIAAGLSSAHQSQVESAVRATALYPFLLLHRLAAERGQVESRVEGLLAERDSLTELLLRYRDRPAPVGEAPRGRDLAALPAGSAAPAVVYPGRPQVGNPDLFVLSGPDFRGREFPVGVFTGIGLVGVVRAPHGRGGRGEFWSHPDFRVSVLAEGEGVSGFVRPLRADGGQPVLLLEGAPFQADIPVGTLLVTTGIAGVYPPGVPVGRIREPDEPEAGWMKRYVVEPSVRPEEVRDVFVWNRPPLPEDVEADTASAPVELDPEPPDTASARR